MREFRDTLDEGAFHVLASRYYERAVGIASERLGAADAAQDAVQETLIRIVRHRRRYNPARPFAPWFFAVLRHVCADLQRRERRRRRTLDEFAAAASVPETDNAAWEFVADLTVGLAPADSELLALRYTEELSLGQIARHLDCSLEAAKKRLQRLLKRLRP